MHDAFAENASGSQPVEAQDQPVATVTIGDTALGNGMRFTALTDAGRALPPGKYELFTRPTPAAADLHQQIMNLPCGPFYRPDSEFALGYKMGHEAARHAAAQLVAASPAAAADLKREALIECRPFVEAHKDGWISNGLAIQSRVLLGKIDAALASSPVALGAPTRLTDEQIKDLWRHTDWVEEAQSFDLRVLSFARALLSAQGCELATDATKQQMFNGLTQEETDATASVMGLVHLAATPIDQDFRMRPVSSEAAPSAEGQE